MKPYLHIFNIIIVLSLQGCSINSNRVANILPEKSELVINNKISRTSINTKMPKFNLFDIYNDGLTDYLLLYNKNLLLIEVTDLNTHEVVLSKSINTIFEMPDEYGEIRSIEFVNFDSIFILQEYAIKLIDTTKEKLSIIINSDADKAYENCLLTNQNHAPIYFDKINNSLSIESYCYTCYFYDKSYYMAPIHVSFSVENHKFKPLPVYYPKMYVNDYFGFHNLVFRSEYRDKYILGFSADTHFYIYDKNEKQEKIYNGRSKFQYLETEPLKKKFKNDSNKKLKHLTLSPVYKETLYDEKRNLYYRFFLTGINEKNDDGTYNAWSDKELVLMIFDGDLKLVNELNLGKDIYNTSKSFVGDKGLYMHILPQNDSIHLNTINYDIFEFY